MPGTQIAKAMAAILASREILTIEDLPPRFNRRWNAEQKRQLLCAIDIGVLTAREAAARYALDQRELGLWREARDAASPAPVARMAPPAPVDRLARLIEILLERRLIDEADVASLDMPRDAAWRSRMSTFMVDDRPIF